MGKAVVWTQAPRNHSFRKSGGNWRKGFIALRGLTD
jgi:hypothetical protein